MDSLTMLTRVAAALGDLKEKLVFVGGATVSLYSTNPAASETRPTDDVDCTVELATRAEYYKLEGMLRAKGFTNNQTVICRWDYKGICVDIMPSNTAQVTITDYTGKTVKTTAVNASSLNVPLSGTAAGLYFYSVLDNSGTILYSSKFAITE